jgi:hypothetical protein
MSAPLLTCFIDVAGEVVELPWISGVISVFSSEAVEETEERAGDSESSVGFFDARKPRKTTSSKPSTALRIELSSLIKAITAPPQK